MAINPNHIPWLTVTGLAGGALGFLVGKLIGFSGDPMLPPLVGFCAGMPGGVLVRILVRRAWLRRQAAPGPSPEGPAGGAPAA